ncbi:MAG: hypothetical protein KJP07_22070 [Desulfatitalea sp.]|nr:hypothetical protein [Desulfatitalea sp.]
MYLIDTDILMYNPKGNETVKHHLRQHLQDPGHDIDLAELKQFKAQSWRHVDQEFADE